MLLLLAGDVFAASRLWTPVATPSRLLASRFARLSRTVLVDGMRLDAPGDTVLVLPLPSGDSLRVVRTRLEPAGPNGIAWVGRVADDPLSDVTFVRVDDTIAGTVHGSDGRIHRVRYAGRGLHALEELDPRLIPGCGQRRLLSTLSDSTSAGAICTTDRGDRIDVMVLYTHNALDAALSQDAMEAAVHQAMSQANDSYLQSGIALRVNLVHLAEMQVYADAGYLHEDLDALQYETDGISGVKTLRDRFGADLVVMIPREGRDDCGLATPLIPSSTANAGQAYAVVPFDCLTIDSNFAHEMGHLMAARHDWASDGARDATHPENHGYAFRRTASGSPAAYRTVMAEQNACNVLGVTDRAECRRLARWSDPAAKSELVDPLGTTAPGVETNNVETLNRTAGTVANFRCSSPERPDAWMQDAWIDTGVEPEPLLAGRPMWKSPSIWVRNSADSDRIQTHRHQNPIKDRANYAYVKIQGGSTDLTGTLELYAAKASTGLAWRPDWVLVEGKNLAPLSARETRIVEFAWTPLEAGHFCLAARWVCDGDPMKTNPEPADMDLATRENNNIVWRNVNIIDLGGGSSGSVQFSIRNTGEAPAPHTLALVPADSADREFFRRGTIAFALDRALMAQWRKSGSRGSGFTRRKDRLVIDSPQGAILEGLDLPVGRALPVHLFVDAGEAARGPRRTYHFDVIQSVVGGKRRSAVVGGVSYDIVLGPPEGESRQH